MVSLLLKQQVYFFFCLLRLLHTLIPNKMQQWLLIAFAINSEFCFTYEALYDLALGISSASSVRTLSLVHYIWVIFDICSLTYCHTIHCFLSASLLVPLSGEPVLHFYFINLIYYRNISYKNSGKEFASFQNLHLYLQCSVVSVIKMYFLLC